MNAANLSSPLAFFPGVSYIDFCFDGDIDSYPIYPIYSTSL